MRNPAACRIANPPTPPIKINGIDAKLISSALDACLVPCRAATWAISCGLILAADDESELAAVMSHEIAHVAARHGTRQASKAELIKVASIPLIFMGGGC